VKKINMKLVKVNLGLQKEIHYSSATKMCLLRWVLDGEKKSPSEWKKEIEYQCGYALPTSNSPSTSKLSTLFINSVHITLKDFVQTYQELFDFPDQMQVLLGMR